MSLHFLAPQIMDFNLNGRVVSRNGNRSETAAPEGAYPCLGDDRWCTIAVEDEEQWNALRRVMGDPAWAREARFETAEGRLEHQDDLDRHMAEWTGGQTAQELMRLLQSAGVPAGGVQRSSDLLQDPQLAHRGFYNYLDHPEMGNIPYSGHQFRIRGYESGPRMPSPMLGEHNEVVLRDILGLTDEEIAEAIISGGIS